MKEWDEHRTNKVRGPNKKRTRKKKRTHQIGPISDRECLHDVLDYDDGGGGDQLSHPFCNLAGLKCLHGLLARVPNSSEMTQQERPKLQWLNTSFDHGS